jgi:hypothetical protein
VKSLGLWSARALVELGRFVRAWQRYAEVAHLELATGNTAVQLQAQRDAARELAELGPRLAWLRIRSVGARASQVLFTLDRKRIPRAKLETAIAMDPGRHVIEGRQAGRVARSEVVLAEGESSTVELRFGGRADVAGSEASAGGDGPWRVAGWTAVALGGAALATGAAFGISSLVDRGALDDSGCDLERNRCAFEQRELVDAYNTKLIVSGVGLIAGGALAAAGAYLLIFETGRSPESSPDSASGSARVQLRVAADSVALQGRF